MNKIEPAEEEEDGREENGEQEFDENDDIFNEIYEDAMSELIVDFQTKFQREPSDDELVSIRQKVEQHAEDMINEMAAEENDDCDEEEEEEEEEEEDLTSPLIAAVVAGDLTAVQNQLEQGADINQVTNFGCTAMWHAATKGHLEIVRLLLQHDADKEKVDARTGATPLYQASFKNHLHVVKLLVESGAEIDKTDDYDWTPLIIASFLGHVEVVRYLLQQRADMDKTDDCGYTALHKSAAYGHLDVAKLLMVYGADLNARNNSGDLPIDVANTCGQLPIDDAHTEEIKQAILDEPKRRIDYGVLRATKDGKHGAVVIAEQEDGDGEEDKQSNKRPRLD